MKQSLVNGLYVSGIDAPGLLRPRHRPAARPDRLADPPDRPVSPTTPIPTATSIIDEIKTHHSSFYIDPSVAPAPMLMSSGFTDDLFPADETIRFYNRTKVQHPSTPLSLFFGDFGHQRAPNKTDVSRRAGRRENAWLDFYVKGTGARRRTRA